MDPEEVCPLLDYSFTFGGVDMRKEYGVWITAYDVLLPPLRSHKITVPGRSGAYDYGSNEYGERTLRLNCDTRTGKTRAQMRQIAYVLSRKNRIALWREPDKTYVGRLYDPSELEDLGQVVYKFALTFLCEPFAYGETKDVVLEGDTWTANYGGTARTPTRIQITNTGTTNATGIQISVAERRDSF